MTFAEPMLALAIFALPVVWAAMRYGARRQASVAQHFRTDLPGLGVAGDRWIRAARYGFVVLAVAALMQPLWGMRSEEAPRTGRDIVVLIDVSLSMLAEDVAPNRLEAAKEQVRRLADAVSGTGGHRLALVAFAGRAKLISPLTLDYELFADRLEQVRAGTAASEGSAVGEAVLFALDKINVADPGYVDLVLLTDGEDHGGAARAAAREAAATGAKLYARAIGAPGEGALIPAGTPEDGSAVVQFDGFPVRTRIDEPLLREIAGVGGGRYLGAGPEAGALAALFHDVIARGPQRELDQVSAEVPAQRFQWFLLAAILFLLTDVRAMHLFQRRPA